MLFGVIRRVQGRAGGASGAAGADRASGLDEFMGSSLSARVLMTADTVGGVWTYALELARALGEQGVEVALATMGAALREEQKAEAQALPRLKLFESDFRLEWMENPWKDVDRSGEWLLELEDQLHPDFIHLNSFAHGALP